jgi:protoporphyrinogen/coproporphyrinogen III oxidase
MPDIDVAVVGGGLAGIASAVAAKKAGLEPVVFEADDVAGGKARTTDGCERGPQSFAGRHASFWELFEALGITDDALPLPATSKVRYIARGGRLRKVGPLSGAIRFSELMGIAGDFLRSRPVPPGPLSVHDFFASRFGASFASGPGAAMVTGIYAGDPNKLSARGCFPDFVAAADAKGSLVRGMFSATKTSTGKRGFYTLKGGLGRIGEAAAKVLNLKLSAPVREIRRDGDGFRLQAAGEDWRARALIIATEAHVAAKLLWPVAPELGAALGKLEYVPISVVHWMSGVAKLPSGFGYLAVPSEGLFALGTIFREKHYSTFVRGAEHTDAQLLDGINADLQKLTQGRVEIVLRIERHPWAVFQPTVDITPVRETIPVAADAARIVLAGSYLGSAAMKDAIASGFAAGQKAAELTQRTQQGSRSVP